MTMPHLMNCSHSSDGWCLSCVKEQADENERLRERVRELEAALDRICDSAVLTGKVSMIDIAAITKLLAEESPT